MSIRRVGNVNKVLLGWVILVSSLLLLRQCSSQSAFMVVVREDVVDDETFTLLPPTPSTTNEEDDEEERGVVINRTSTLPTETIAEERPLIVTTTPPPPTTTAANVRRDNASSNEDVIYIDTTTPAPPPPPTQSQSSSFNDAPLITKDAAVFSHGRKKSDFDPMSTKKKKKIPSLPPPDIEEEAGFRETVSPRSKKKLRKSKASTTEGANNSCVTTADETTCTTKSSVDKDNSDTTTITTARTTATAITALTTPLTTSATVFTSTPVLYSTTTFVSSALVTTLSLSTATTTTSTIITITTTTSTTTATLTRPVASNGDSTLATREIPEEESVTEIAANLASDNSSDATRKSNATTNSDPAKKKEQEMEQQQQQCLCPCFELAAMRERDMRNINLDGNGNETTIELLPGSETEQSTNVTTTTNVDETSTPADTTTTTESDDPVKQSLGRYFERLKTIYELDVRILEQLGSVVGTLSTDVIPGLVSSLEPVLNSVQPFTGGNLDMSGLVGLLAKTLKKSEFEASVSTKLGNLDFLNFGPAPLSSTPFGSLIGNPSSLQDLIVADFDNSGFGFPIQALILGPRAYAALTDSSRSKDNDRLVSAILAGKLREFLSGTSTSVTVSRGEIILDTTVRPVQLADRCDASVKTGQTRAVVKVQGSSDLKTSVTISMDESAPAAGGAEEGGDNGGIRATVFLGGDVDVALDASTSVSVRLGKKIFGKCFTKYSNTFPVRSLSHGRVFIGARILASHVRIEQRGNATYLVFQVQVKLDARVNTWSVDHLGVSGCDVRVLGIKIYSFCGALRRKIMEKAGRFSQQFQEVQMPQLLRRIEELLLRRGLGDNGLLSQPQPQQSQPPTYEHDPAASAGGVHEVAIPLLLTEEKQVLAATLLEKVINVAQLKGDLVKDLSKLAAEATSLAQRSNQNSVR